MKKKLTTMRKKKYVHKGRKKGRKMGHGPGMHGPWKQWVSITSQAEKEKNA